MTGKELFLAEKSEIAERDRRTYSRFDAMPLGLQDWWNGRAELPEFANQHVGPILDWKTIKSAVNS